MAQIDKRIPQVGMRFKDSNEAWMFWVEYGGHIGFDVRKRCTNKSKFDGKVTSCRFVCSNEGLRRKCQTEREPKRFRAETRTDCLVRMVITLDRATENYEIIEVVLEHNHYLQLPQTRHLLASQRKISELQAFEIETADDSGIMPKAAHEFACRKGRNVVENPKLEAQLRYQDLSHKFHNLAHKAANYLECCVLLENALDSVAPQIEDKLNATTSAMNEPCKDKENVEPNVQQTNEFLCSAQLKKKEVQSRNLRRKKGWLDKLLKGKRKSTKTTAPTKKGAKICCYLHDLFIVRF
ncbi:hypothetical protein VPH35_101109 [Triticum aestivum]